jgi:hypothetical protein
MKTIILSLFAIVAVQGSAFAAVPCSSEIINNALEKASAEGYGICRVTDLRENETLIAEDSERGTISLICQHHVSQYSVVTETVLYQFSVPAFGTIKALECTDVSVTDSAQQ